jgi:Helix-turn-helix domain
MTSQSSTQSHPVAPRLLYDRKEAARQLSISVRSLDYLIAGKKIAIRRIGSRILIPHEELVRLATSAHVRSVVDLHPVEHRHRVHDLAGGEVGISHGRRY